MVVTLFRSEPSDPWCSTGVIYWRYGSVEKGRGEKASGIHKVDSVLRDGRFADGWSVVPRKLSVVLKGGEGLWSDQYVSALLLRIITTLY